MLASVLHESISPQKAFLMLDNFEKVVCVAAAKVPVVKIWDAELYLPSKALLTKKYPMRH